MFDSKVSLSKYGWNLVNSNPRPYSSFRISRPLRGREQLDFSRELGLDDCGLFLHSYWPQNSPGKINEANRGLTS